MQCNAMQCNAMQCNAVPIVCNAVSIFTSLQASTEAGEAGEAGAAGAAGEVDPGLNGVPLAGPFGALGQRFSKHWTIGGTLDS